MLFLSLLRVLQAGTKGGSLAYLIAMLAAGRKNCPEVCDQNHKKCIFQVKLYFYSQNIFLHHE